MKVVVFDSSSKGTTALLGGHVDLSASPAGSFIQHIEAGKLRAIGVAALERLGGALSNIPTWREQGIDAVVGNNRTVIGPIDLSKAQIEYWDSVFTKFSQLDEWKKYLKDNLSEKASLNSTECTKFLNEQYDQFKEVPADLGLAK